MTKNLFYKLFPVPKYLELGSVGLDISDQSVKFVEITHHNGHLKLARYGEEDIPVGVIESGIIKNKEQLVGVLKKIKQKFNFSYAAVSLPEEHAYVIIMKLPAVPKSQIRESIELQLEEYIPLPVDKVVFDYEIYRAPKDDKGYYEIGVSVFPTEILSSYQSALVGAGMIPSAYEIEGNSLARSMVATGDERNYMIVDIGKTRTGFSVLSKGIVLFSSTVGSIGGENITKIIQKNTNLDYQAAEQMKIQNGISRAPKNKELFESLIPTVSSLRDEISRYFLYWQTRKEEDIVTEKIDRVILCGGQSTLPGLVDYVEAAVDVPVALGNPWINMFEDNEEIPPIDYNNALRYSTAIGLALRNIN